MSSKTNKKPKTNKNSTSSKTNTSKNKKSNNSKASTKNTKSTKPNKSSKSLKSAPQPDRQRSASASASKSKKTAHKNRHAPNAKDELFLKLLAKAPELKQWLQKEGIWIQELFETLVMDYKVSKEAHLAQNITSNEEFDALIRKVKLQRLESNKNADDLRRLTLNLLKFEKCWRARTGISRKGAAKVKTTKPTPSSTATKKEAPPRRRADSLPKQPKPKPQPLVKQRTSVAPAPPKLKAPPKPSKMTKSKSAATEMTKSSSSNSNSGASSSAKCQELEKDALAYCSDADKCAENGLFQTAVKFYSFGILALKKTLNLIKSEPDKQQRSKQIDGYKAKKGQVRFTLNKDKLKRREHEHKGMEFCLQAEQCARKGAFDLAIKYYEKGLPFLKKSVENMEHSLTKQYKWNRILRYKGNLNECRQQTGTKSKRSSSSKMANAYGNEHGLLHFVAQGTMDRDVIARADGKDLYLSLPFLISSMALVPMSFKQCFRDPFVKCINDRIESSPLLEQQLKCYLFSYSLDRNVYYNASVKSIYRYHPCMPQLAYEDDDKDDEKLSTDFASYYQDRDCISFFRGVASNMSAIAKLADKLSETTIRKPIDDDITVFDLFGAENQLRSLEILKVFKSNAKPVLVRALTDDPSTQFQYILKHGDDLRRDNGIMAMFKLMNYFWWRRGLRYEKRYDVHCLIYNIVPMGNDFGGLEFIDGCVPISELNKIPATSGADREAFLSQLVCTSAGAYIASFVCGIRDRHYDNILIRKSDGTLFHIDFGYLWTKVGFLDASKMAITKDLKIFMGEHHWNGFVNIAVHAYLVLREHFNEIVSFSTIAFDFIEMTSDSVRPQQYLYNMLRMDLDDDKAQEYITKKLENAPNNIKTKLKNAMHKLATT